MAIPLNQPILCPILIGRQSELGVLRALIEQARDQTRSAPGRMILISGEAGIGKSRLSAEAKAYAREQGFLVLQGACFPTDRSYPYGSLLDLLRSMQALGLLSADI
ncbi:MAG TPA: AAA family ATPase, partial [Ktedonobacterales bacterium]|nr:AAA family ATPase [Ktedonobacterales bacterium]